MKLRTIVILIILCMVMAGAATTQEGPIIAGTARYGDASGTAPKFKNLLSGVIKTIDAHGMVLEKTKAGIDQTFKFQPKTKFIHDNKPSSREDLKVGEQVYVEARQDKKTGDFYAKQVISGIVVPLE